MSSEAFDPKQLPEWKEAAALGVDLELLEMSLKLTPWQRAEMCGRAAKIVEQLQAMGLGKYADKHWLWRGSFSL